jgi:hypothetical protein
MVLCMVSFSLVINSVAKCMMDLVLALCIVMDRLDLISIFYIIMCIHVEVTVVHDSVLFNSG